jgi:hypothetical protein
MILTSILVCASMAAAQQPILVLEKLRSIDDPRGFDFRDQSNGDRGVPRSCTPDDKTTVTLASAKNATLTVARGGSKRTVAINDVAGLGRSTLACGDAGDFYYANPRLGQVYAYSADRLFRGDDPVVWTRHLDPFASIDDAHGVMSEASVATVVQLRQRLVLVEWFFRKDGGTGFWHEVFDAASGAELAKIGPSDLLVRTNAADPWWVVFQGGGNEPVNYVPQNLYRLKYGLPLGDAKPAPETIEVLRTQSMPRHLKAVATLSTNPVINHMIALLSPTRTSPDSRIEFCPQVPPERARYWLGEDYAPELAALARNILLRFWADRQSSDTTGSPIDAWFQKEIAPVDPMRTLLAHFNPQDDQWIAQYQQTLLTLGRSMFEDVFAKYGTATGAVVRTPARKGIP